jgi:hypothetical protein
MRKTTISWVLILITVGLYSQTVTSPDFDRKSASDLYIKSVVTTENYTQINFIYNSSKSQGQYIFLNLPGHKDAYYISANGRTYKLLSTQNIGNTNGTTAAMPGKPIEFSARFERLPSYTSKFDLIEGPTGSWDFYGVQLGSSAKSKTTVEKFRIDYNYITIYNPDTETWSEWQEGENTFVININDKGDIAHLRADGETVIYKKLSGVEEGYTSKDNQHYQIIKALDEDGDVFRFQLFDDTSVGLKMMWGSFMVQFAKL